MKSLGSLFQVGYYYFCYYFSVYYHVKKLIGLIHAMAIFIMFCIACVAARFLGWFSFLVSIYNQCGLLGLEGERKTKNYFEKDNREGAKRSKVEELGSSQSSCTRQNRKCWSKSVVALCTYWRDKTWWEKKEACIQPIDIFETPLLANQVCLLFRLLANGVPKTLMGLNAGCFSHSFLPPLAPPSPPFFFGLTTVPLSRGCISYFTNHKEKNSPKLQ